MIKVVLVEDDFMSLSVLEDILQEHFSGQLEVVAKADGVETAIKALAQHQPQLLFLDIHLPDGDGFEVLEHVSTADCRVIFTTAYDQYALRAFDYMALHYLLKPIDEEQLIAVIQRFLNQSMPSQLTLQMDLLKQLLQNTPPRLTERIGIAMQQDLVFIHIADILYLAADGGYTEIVLREGQPNLWSSKTLGFYEKQLVGHPFFRIHDKYLINLKHINKYIKGKGGLVEMLNGQQLMVATRRKSDFLKALQHAL